MNIVSKINGVGLDQDVRLLTRTLQSQGFKVTFSEHKGMKSAWRYCQRAHRYDANIFIERFFPCWTGLAANNFVIPNQERFPARILKPLKKHCNGVLCKTRHAQNIFSAHTHTAEYIGFTSQNKYRSGIDKNYSEFFHLAGKSSVKGTEDILALWALHPEWPRLTLVQHPDKAPGSVPANVNLLAERLSDTDLSQLQNSIGIHLCLSRSEGWGHYIAEAMSTGAVVITTDGEPMNELVNSTRGVLVKSERSEKRHLGTNYFFDAQSLEKKIRRLITTTDEEKVRLGEQARHWFKENEAQFGPRLAAAIKRLI
ncbi:hypothetical protein AB833_01100 [Chromatiales bacterium (ex Bugula neritina AB1)]|nr:hypothetical protein AB833_01100 [Chromatiales bacterium (ex Bugula neritina AB1)]